MILNSVLNTLCEFISDKLDTKHISIMGFRSLLEIILFNNVFSFNSSFFVQIKGIAMGCKCAPSLANLYLSILEDKFLFIYKPFYYKRYIDDLFIIVIKNFDISLLFSYFQNLKLTLSCKNNTVNFLDLNISLDYTLNRIKISLYIKPTQNFSFLLHNSNHPNFIFKNSPKSILIRIRRNCSDLVDYLYFSNIYLYHFLKRGYSYINFCKISHMIALLNRDSLLSYKVKNKKTFPPFTIHGNSTFDKNLLNFNNFMKDSFNSLKNESEYVNLLHYKLKIHNNMQPNIGALLIHNIPSFNLNLSNFKYYTCTDSNCKVCKYASKANTIKVKNNVILPILCSSSCNSNGIIYIIYCNLCHTYYIGQSSRSVKTRINEHLLNINNHICFSDKSTTVSNHFNLINHDISNFSFYIYTSNLHDDKERTKLEAKLIYIFKNVYNIKLINNKFPNPYNW
jgi:hypothetical protein